MTEASRAAAPGRWTRGGGAAGETGAARPPPPWMRPTPPAPRRRPRSCRTFRTSTHLFHADDPVAGNDPVGDLHPPHRAAEHRVGAVQVRLRRMGDEPLAPPRVRPAERHPQRAEAVRVPADLG